MDRAFTVLTQIRIETMAKTYDQSSTVTAEGGDVLVDGPDGVAVAMTPRAAGETGHKLIEGAAQAQGQRLMGIREPDSD